MPSAATTARNDSAISALARANLYNLLATVFAQPPSARLASAIVDGTLAQALRHAGLNDLALELDQSAAAYDEVGLLRELEVEYARLFLIPGPHRVPPYQSMYYDDPPRDEASRSGRRFDKRHLWGDSAVATQRIYERAGLAVSGELRDVPDHIGIQLQFMHHLCSREAEALNAGHVTFAQESERLQREFLQGHLLPWVGRFCEAVADGTNQPLFKAMAMLARCVVAHDAQELGADIRDESRA